MSQQLLIATTNTGKRKEIFDLLKGLPLELLTPADISLDMDVEENGVTYLENARLKAQAFCRASQLPTLADDTGLEVEALNGQPGLRSHRFTGSADASDPERRAYLLRKLRNKPRPWAARFVCAVVLALPNGRRYSYEDACVGEIIPEERGTGGFGYDPIFLFPQEAKTMAELSLDEKNRISHRARAIQGILPILKDLRV
ncbi:MAG: XTP/dITP diphosphohydrolase [Chloroflexota bacterium]|nr:XTP/dITP diphosphohydrolase [Chloroflexota bacterium]